MPVSQLDAIARHVRMLAGAVAAKDATDADLLRRFSLAGDEAAFSALVERHAGMVWSACRRALDRPEDAEDAFQATFLILFRKAGSIRKRTALASWLYGVARRTALRMRRSAAQRRQPPIHPSHRKPEEPVAAAALRDLQSLLDEEVERLPEMYRAPFVLCCLEGRSRTEAARQLAWKEGTVAGRVARARKLLQQRLARRGVSLSAVLCAGAIADQTTAAAPAALIASVTSGALRATAGKAVFGSPLAVALARSVMRSLAASRLMVAATFWVAGGLLALSAVGMACRLWAEMPVAGQPQDSVAMADDSSPVSDKPPANPVDLYGDPLPEGVLSRLGTIRFRHGWNITSVAFAPDGKAVVTVGLDSTLRLWELETGAQRAQFRSPNRSQFFCVAFAPDGRTVAAVNNVGIVWLVDSVSAKEIRTFHARQPQALCFSPDGRVLASASRHGIVWLWDTTSGKELRHINVHKDQVTALAFAPDGQVLATAGADKTIRLWSSSTGKELYIDELSKPAIALAFSPDGKLLASGGGDQLVHLWDPIARKKVRQIPVQARVASGIAFSPSGKLFAVASREYAMYSEDSRGGIDLFDVSTGEHVRQLVGPRRPFESVAFSPDGKTLAGTGGHDSTLHLWEVATGREIIPAKGHQAPVWSVAAAPDNRTVATAGADDTVRVWDMRTAKQLCQFKGSRAWFSRNGMTLLTLAGGDEPTLNVWSVAAGKQQLRQALPIHNLFSAALSADGGALAFEGADHVIHLWDIAKRKERGRLAGHRQRVGSLAFSPDGNKLASASVEEKRVYLWDLASLREIRRFDAAPGSLAFSPDGGLLAAGGEDEGIHMWDTTTGKEIYLLADDRTLWARACNVAFSPDGRTLAGGCMNGELHLWETATGKVRRRLHGSLGGFGTPAFSPDGRLLIAGCSDTTALVWDLRAGNKELLSERELDSLWDELGYDAANAYQAIGKLITAAGQSVPFLRRRLVPGPGPDDQRMAELIADLDSTDFKTRQWATKMLAEQGEAVVPALRKALDGSPSPEVRSRALPILEAWDGPERRRPIRSLEVLEHAGTAEARQVLESLAGGNPDVPLTRDAKASLARLTR